MRWISLNGTRQGASWDILTLDSTFLGYFQGSGRPGTYGTVGPPSSEPVFGGRRISLLCVCSPVRLHKKVALEERERTLLNGMQPPEQKQTGTE